MSLIGKSTCLYCSWEARTAALGAHEEKRYRPGDKIVVVDLVNKVPYLWFLCNQ